MGFNSGFKGLNEQAVQVSRNILNIILATRFGCMSYWIYWWMPVWMHDSLCSRNGCWDFLNRNNRNMPCLCLRKYGENRKYKWNENETWTEDRNNWKRVELSVQWRYKAENWHGDKFRIPDYLKNKTEKVGLDDIWRSCHETRKIKTSKQ